MDRKLSSCSQANDVHVFQAHISQFLIDSARYLELEIDSATVETVLQPVNQKVMRNYQEVCHATDHGTL